MLNTKIIKWRRCSQIDKSSIDTEDNFQKFRLTEDEDFKGYISVNDLFFMNHYDYEKVYFT